MLLESFSTVAFLTRYLFPTHFCHISSSLVLFVNSFFFFFFPHEKSRQVIFGPVNVVTMSILGVEEQSKTKGPSYVGIIFLVKTIVQ